MKIYIFISLLISTLNCQANNDLQFAQSRAASKISIRVIDTIPIKSIKYRCQFLLTHNCDEIKIKNIEVKCLPSKPKRQVATNVRISGGDFTYQMNLAINPTSVTRVKFLKKAPKCIPASTTTTSTTSSTTTSTTNTNSETEEGTTVEGTTLEGNVTTLSTTTTDEGTTGEIATSDEGTTEETATTDEGTTNETATTDEGTTATTNESTTGGETINTSDSTNSETTTRPGGPSPPSGYYVNTTVDAMSCACNCSCPAGGGDCGCGCLCPYQPLEPSSGSSCSLGYTRVCPRRGAECPEDMLHLCPKDMTNQMETEQPRDNKAKLLSLVVTKNIVIKQIKFRCKITIVHTYFAVNVRQSDIKCSPSTPKNQKIRNVLVIGNGYRFELDISINPTRIESANVAKAPATTTPRTTSTTTTMFSYTGCDCLADFVLFFSKKAMADRIGGSQQAGNTSFSWSPGYLRISGVQAEGNFSQRFSVPGAWSGGLGVKSRQVDLFMSACYCVQKDKMEHSGAVINDMEE